MTQCNDIGAMKVRFLGWFWSVKRCYEPKIVIRFVKFLSCIKFKKSLVNNFLALLTKRCLYTLDGAVQTSQKL